MRILRVPSQRAVATGKQSTFAATRTSPDRKYFPLGIDYHHSGQVFFYELDDLVGRRSWFTSFGRRPTPLYKFPPVVCDRRFVRSLRRIPFQDGVKDLLIAREIAIGDTPCQNLPSFQ